MSRDKEHRGAAFGGNPNGAAAFGGRPIGSVFLIILYHKCLWEPKGYPYTARAPEKKRQHPAVCMDIVWSRT